MCTNSQQAGINDYPRFGLRKTDSLSFLKSSPELSVEFSRKTIILQPIFNLKRHANEIYECKYS